MWDLVFPERDHELKLIQKFLWTPRLILIETSIDFGATIEEGLHFRHKPYIYLYSPEERELTSSGSQTPKQGLVGGEGQKPIFTQNTSIVSSMRGIHLKGHTPKGDGLNLIRGDPKGRSKTFQYVQNSDVLSCAKFAAPLFQHSIVLPDSQCHKILIYYDRRTYAQHTKNTCILRFPGLGNLSRAQKMEISQFW